MNGKVINHASVARDTGADVKTIHGYLEILEDTLVGFQLDAFESSFRRRLARRPKFFFFDLGVARALNRTLTVPLIPQTGAFGEAFEHFCILEAHRLQTAFERDYRFSYLQTKDDVEIDLVVERPGKPLVLIEIKSTEQVRDDHIRSLERVGASFPGAQLVCLCRETLRRRVRNVDILPWDVGLRELFIP